MTKDSGLNLENTYLNLNNKMYSIMEPVRIDGTELILINNELSDELGIKKDFLESKDGLLFLTGSTNQYGTLFSQAYAGHQYGHFTMLGDGRAVVLGEHINKENMRFDLQLKGSGRTPYSRRGDGKATLYSMLREYLISEAMNGLNIPTSRSLAVVKTNEKIQRTKLEEGAILTRVAKSHIRVGTFEYTKVYGGKELVKELADYTIKRHYSELDKFDNKYQLLLHEVVKRQASLIASWQSVGFIHGVMNTDNVLISGETIDYGPCAFMDQYDPKTVFSSIDREGRYAYQNQPYIGSWNLSRFAESILELLDDNQEKAIEKANTELQKFGEYYKKYWLENMAAKIGIKSPISDDEKVITDLLKIMEMYKADYTNTFSLLTQNKFEDIIFYNTEEWKNWFIDWTKSLGYRKTDLQERMQLMKESNPVVIPRNQIVEEALMKATELDDYSLFYELLSIIKIPYDYTKKHKEIFTNPINVEGYKTYCGT